MDSQDPERPSGQPPGQGLDQGRPDRGAQLMLAWQAGDESAFESLVHEFSGPVYGLLTRFLGTSAAREDMVQEVFLRVVRAKDKYQPTARFTTWLYRIAFNLSVNETERNAGRTPASLSSTGDGAAPPEPADERHEPALDGMERGDKVQEIRTAIAELPETQRMALVLAKYEDMPYIQIAEVLGSTEKAIKSLIHRARETLRTRLAHLLTQEPA